MLTEIAPRLIRELNERIFKNLPGEDVDTHRSKIASGLRGFLFKLEDFFALVRDNETETRCLLPRNGISGDRDIGLIALMELEQDLVVHLINMITAEDENILGVIVFHVLKVLVDGIGRTGVPLGIVRLLIRRENAHATDVSVKIPRDTDTDVGVKPQGLILRKNTDRVYA